MRLIFGELTLRLLQLDLERTRVNLGEQISFVNVLAFPERDVDELAVHAAANGHGIKCGYGSQTIEIDGEITLPRGGNNNGHGETAHAGTTRSAPATASRCGRRGIRRFTGSAHTPEIPNANDNAGNDEHPEPPKTLRRLIRLRVGSEVATLFG